jgi:hypothetical protein
VPVIGESGTGKAREQIPANWGRLLPLPALEREMIEVMANGRRFRLIRLAPRQCRNRSSIVNAPLGVDDNVK